VRVPRVRPLGVTALTPVDDPMDQECLNAEEAYVRCDLRLLLHGLDDHAVELLPFPRRLACLLVQSSLLFPMNSSHRTGTGTDLNLPQTQQSPRTRPLGVVAASQMLLMLSQPRWLVSGCGSTFVSERRLVDLSPLQVKKRR
jgi:hypothetical protein